MGNQTAAWVAFFIGQMISFLLLKIWAGYWINAIFIGIALLISIVLIFTNKTWNSKHTKVPYGNIE